MTGPLAEGALVDGKYRIEKFLGEGGMGIVYQATEMVLERQVAIKLLKGELTTDTQSVRRFRDELRVLAGFNHPNITTLFTSFNWQGMPAMVMELVEGETFRGMVFRRGPIPEQVSVPLVIQALQGVAEAHRRGIAHRDLKPENLMLNTEGTVKVMDFGIAKMEQAPGFTRTSTVLGTPHYMSPEQIDPSCFGLAGVDLRTDIYSMGILLYEMLAGVVPFSGPSEFSVQRAHLEELPQPPTVHYPHIRAGVVAAVFKAMEKNPGKRYQSAAEFSQALRAALAEAPAAVLSSPLSPLPPAKGKQTPPVPASMPVANPAAAVPHLPAAPGMTAAIPGNEPAREQAIPVSVRTAAAPAPAEIVSTEQRGPGALLQRWFGHTGRPRIVGAVAALLALCVLGGGAAGLVALLRPNPAPGQSAASGSGSSSSSAASPSVAFSEPSESPLPAPAATPSGSESDSNGGAEVQLPVPPTHAKGQSAANQSPKPAPALQPAADSVAGIWTGNFSGCSGSGLTQAGMVLRESSGGSEQEVAVKGSMLVHTEMGENVKCGVDGTYKRTSRRLVLSTSCPLSVPAFLSASRQSLLSVIGGGQMTGTVSPENCAVASFNKK